MFLDKTRNSLALEGELEWDSSADLFANESDDMVIKAETDPLGYHVSTQTHDYGNIQLRREMAGAIKESNNVNKLLERIKKFTRRRR